MKSINVDDAIDSLIIQMSSSKTDELLHSKTNQNVKALIQPYLFFDGNCEEAIEFYKENLDAEVDMLMRFSECPDPLPPEMATAEIGEKVMHATLHIGGNVVMASDSVCGDDADPTGFSGFSLSLALENESEARRIFDLLGDGGTVEMPLDKTFWSPCFGMLRDRFGMGWMVTVQP